VHPESVARLALLDELNAGDGQALGISVDLRNAAGGAGGNQQGGTDGTKIKAMVAAGTPPDLYYTAYYDSAEYYTAGMTVDLAGAAGGHVPGLRREQRLARPPGGDARVHQRDRIHLEPGAPAAGGPGRAPVGLDVDRLPGEGLPVRRPRGDRPALLRLVLVRR